jgi:hypothetical protein
MDCRLKFSSWSLSWEYASHHMPPYLGEGLDHQFVQQPSDWMLHDVRLVKVP